jgi:hypothetical protein
MIGFEFGRSGGIGEHQPPANAPGSWPVSNPTLNDMTWTNPIAVSSSVFYRLRSVVP